MNEILDSEEEQRSIAQNILEDLKLLELWRQFGEPYLVGAMTYRLMVAPDIDIEIYCPGNPRIEDGFEVLKACACNSRVRRARFSNHMDDADQGYYWMLRYDVPGGEQWKIDMWSMRFDHPGPTSCKLVEPLCRVLTDEARVIILTLKKALLAEPGLACPSIFIYQAVLEGGVNSLDEFLGWRKSHPWQGLTHWSP